MPPLFFRRPGLLDRLIDDFPEEQNPRDPAVAAEEAESCTWEAWREGLRRDLAMLLSTRLPARAAKADHPRTGKAAHPRVAESVARYGVAYASSGRSRAVEPDAILKAIIAFEPRLRDPDLLPGEAEQGAVCSLSGWVEWPGGEKNLVAKVFSVGDGWKVELYE